MLTAVAAYTLQKKWRIINPNGDPKYGPTRTVSENVGLFGLDDVDVADNMLQTSETTTTYIRQV